VEIELDRSAGAEGLEQGEVTLAGAAVGLGQTHDLVVGLERAKLVEVFDQRLRRDVLAGEATARRPPVVLADEGNPARGSAERAASCLVTSMTSKADCQCRLSPGACFSQKLTWRFQMSLGRWPATNATGA